MRKASVDSVTATALATTAVRPGGPPKATERANESSLVIFFSTRSRAFRRAVRSCLESASSRSRAS